MLHFSQLKIAGMALVFLAGIIFSLPNFLSASTRLSMPDYLPSSALNLGLDLQGGSHLLLSVDMKSVQRERLDDLTGDVRLALRGQSIGYSAAPFRHQVPEFVVALQVVGEHAWNAVVVHGIFLS